MHHLCPKCHTEMVQKSNVYVCPLNDIGDCDYDALQLDHCCEVNFHTQPHTSVANSEQDRSRT